MTQITKLKHVSCHYWLKKEMVTGARFVTFIGHNIALDGVINDKS